MNLPVSSDTSQSNENKKVNYYNELRNTKFKKASMFHYLSKPSINPKCQIVISKSLRFLVFEGELRINFAIAHEDYTQIMS